MATSDASVMMRVGAFCLGCTRRMALARACLMSVKAAVLTSSQARVAFPFVAARRALRGLRMAAQPGMNQMIKVDKSH